VRKNVRDTLFRKEKTMIFRPKNRYSVKKDRRVRLKTLLYVLIGIAVFLLGFFTSGPILRLFS